LDGCCRGGVDPKKLYRSRKGKSMEWDSERGIQTVNRHDKPGK
jgi:hypothetical protein